MAKKKIYVVKEGHKTGIFEHSTWDVVKTYIDGYSGAVYKGFTNMVEAKEYYLDEKGGKSTVKKKNTKLKGTWNEESFDYKGLVAFTDGSCLKDSSKYSFGLVVLEDGKVVHEDGRAYDDEFISSRQVAGELKGVIAALAFAKENDIKHVKVCYDYTGVQFWVDGTWNANKKLSQMYQKTINHFKQFMEIEFVKVPAHDNVKYNERADYLAKKALGLVA